MKFHYILFFLSSSFLFSQTAITPSGTGTSLDPYLISNEGNFYWMTQNSSEWVKNFKQTNNIDLSSSNTWDSGSGISPIGTPTNPFTGVYDGNYKSVSGIYMSRSGFDQYGIFGYVNNGVVKNLKIISASLSLTLKADYSWRAGAGILIGVLDNNASSNNVENVIIESSTISVTKINLGSVGGLIGLSKGGNVQYTSVDSDVFMYNNGTYKLRAGGFIGSQEGGVIKYSLSSGSVTSSNGYRLGGFIGEISASSNIEECFSVSDVTSIGFSGGFVGSLDDSTIKNCYALGAVISTSTSPRSGDVFGSFFGSS